MFTIKLNVSDVPELPWETPSMIYSKIAILCGRASQTDLDNEAYFAGATGRFLFGFLNGNKVSRRECLVGAIVHKVSTIATPNEAYISSMLTQYPPNVVLLIGKEALAYAKPGASLIAWRGSVFVPDSGPLAGFKCLATHHPSEVFKETELSALVDFDLRRAIKESTHAELVRPSVSMRILNASESISWLQTHTNTISPFAFDIEGGCEQGISCVSFADSPTSSVLIPLQDFANFELVPVMRALSIFLSSSTPKILQNALYDSFVFAWLHKIRVKHLIWDTMLSGWEFFPELRKGLATQTSIWTDVPYYKSDRKKDDKLVFYQYCCRDSMVTFELFLRHNEAFTPDQRAHFEFNMRLLRPALYMQLRGFRFDDAERKRLLVKAQEEIIHVRKQINDIAALSGVLSLNPASPKQMTDFLYKKMHYPVQTNKTMVDGVERKSATSDVDALLELGKKFNGPSDAIIPLLLSFRNLDKRRQFLEVEIDRDSRIRCGYNVVGTDTCRFSCTASSNGKGTNLQTVTSKLKHLFLADEGKYLWNVDLSGADGWTVAAWSATLGDPTMLDDYAFGLKPAKIIALMYSMGAEVSTLSRDELKRLSADVSEEGSNGWLYAASKACQHGTSYGMKEGTMVDQVLKQSFKKTGKPIYVTRLQMRTLQSLFYRRYPGVQEWQAKVKRDIMREPVMRAASTHVRNFFGVVTDNHVQNKALAHEPQHNTSFATNTALLRLWTDAENRDSRGRLIIEPVHQVHDSLNGQCAIEHEAMLLRKVPDWFNTTLRIAGRDVKIPFSGTYGKDWKNQTFSIK
jgi:hypothetical protein